MAARAKTIAVNQTPVIVVDASRSIDGVKATLSNAGGLAVWIGGDDMTPSNYLTNGIQIAPTLGLDDVDLPDGDQLFAYLPSGVGSVIVLATGV